MDNAMLDIIKRIITDHGDAAFGNMPRVNAILLDLAPGMTRERILVRNFIEMDGYRTLLSAGGEYPLVRNKLVRELTDIFCVERAAARWVVGLFAAVLGYETESPGAPAAAQAEIEMPEENNPAGFSGLPAVAIGKAHFLAVAEDGTVFSHGRNDRFQCDVSNWRGIVAVAAGDEHSVGLRRDGEVLAAGSNTYDQCDVSRLSGSKAIYAFGHNTVAVKADGTVESTGKLKYDLSHFNQIVSVAKYPEGLLGIRGDGRVMAARASVPQLSQVFGISDDDESLEVIRWAETLTDAVQIISTYINGSVVLKSDGCIYKMREPDNYFAPWRDIVSIVDLSDSFAILRADGTVRVLPFDRDKPRVSTVADSWYDIVAIYGKYKRLIGLTSDRRLVSAGTDPEWLKRNGPLDFLGNWRPIAIPTERP
jgi:hypothetical protein